ncbi:hypothetical protein C8R43DRAFT_974536 [Mycena crocata]|nr:hypothetical protein C8R43DRAFT_974536 [Mycena crocata]
MHFSFYQNRPLRLHIVLLCVHMTGSSAAHLDSRRSIRPQLLTTPTDDFPLSLNRFLLLLLLNLLCFLRIST